MIPLVEARPTSRPTPRHRASGPRTTRRLATRVVDLHESPAYKARVARMLDTLIPYVRLSLFRRPDAERRILEWCSRAAATVEAIGQFVEGDGRTITSPRPMSIDESRAWMVRRYFYLWRASRTRETLRRDLRNVSAVEAIEADLRRAVEARNRIVSSLMRMLVSIIAEYATTHEKWHQFDALLSDGSLQLISIVDRYYGPALYPYVRASLWKGIRTRSWKRIRKQRGRDRRIVRCKLSPFSIAEASIRRHRDGEEVDQRQHYRDVAEAMLHRAPPHAQTIMRKRYGLDGEPESKRQIAEAVDLPETTVDSQIVAWRRKLRDSVPASIDLETVDPEALQIREVNWPKRKPQPWRKRPGGFPSQRKFDHDEILRLLRQGAMTYDEIAAKVGCSAHNVGDIGRRNGLRRGLATKKRQYDHDEIRRQLSEGQKPQQVADAVGCSVHLVNKIKFGKGRKKRTAVA